MHLCARGRSCARDICAALAWTSGAGVDRATAEGSGARATLDNLAMRCDNLPPLSCPYSILFLLPFNHSLLTPAPEAETVNHLRASQTRSPARDTYAQEWISRNAISKRLLPQLLCRGASVHLRRSRSPSLGLDLHPLPPSRRRPTSRRPTEP